MKHPLRFQPSMIWMMGLLLIIVVAWALLFDVDQTVRAQGQLVPVTRTQIIQAADGGVLEKIHVVEGQSVRAGEVLAVLEDERARAGVEEGRTKVAALTINLARARAEATGQALVFPKETLAYKDLLHEQEALYRQKLHTLQSESVNIEKSLQLARDELSINERLLATGDSSRLEVMRAQRQVAELQGKLEALRNKYLQDARQEATKVQDELASQRFKLEERASVLQHTQLTTPVAGIVKYLRVNTVGGVLKGGDELMQISPTDVDLEVEVKIQPVDIGQLHPGLPVSIKLDAYDSSVYGSLEGALDYISSDTLTEQAPSGQAQSTYRARISFNKASANPKLHLADLKPGMTATIDIKTGKRSVMAYLIKPIAKAFSGAARER